MRALFHQLFNIGVTDETDLNSAKKIRLSNIIPLVGVITGSFVLLVMVSFDGPFIFVLVNALIIISLLRSTNKCNLNPTSKVKKGLRSKTFKLQ